MQKVILISIILFLSYILGSIPFGLIISRLWGVDIRKHGSGNIGATNVLRVLGIVPGIIVFVIDLLKGTAAVYLAYFTLGTTSCLWIVLAGAAAVLGHMFSLFIGFRGGRGAATGLGVVLGITPDLFLYTAIIVVLIIAVTRYVSVGSILGSISLAAMMFIFQKPLEYAWASVVVAVLIILRHIPNIKRLLGGTEHKIGGK